MNTLFILCIFLFVFLLCFVLYQTGHLTMQSKRAVTFIGRGLGNFGGRASFTSCTGFLKRIIRFSENQVYHFSLDCELRNGIISIEIQNERKETVLLLDIEHPEGNVEVQAGEKYCILVSFQYASGRYSLQWN